MCLPNFCLAGPAVAYYCQPACPIACALTFIKPLAQPTSLACSCASHPAVRDDSYRAALALKGERLYTRDFEAAHLSGVLAAVGRLLLPDTGPLSARLHARGAYTTGGGVG